MCCAILSNLSKEALNHRYIKSCNFKYLHILFYRINYSCFIKVIFITIIDCTSFRHELNLISMLIIACCIYCIEYV